MAEKNYYELLDIAPEAGEQEIEEAYKCARAVYAEDSVALYSLYSQEERESMLRMINDAYETLRNQAKRKAYDVLLSSDFYKRKMPQQDDRKMEVADSNFSEDTAETRQIMFSVKPKKTSFAMEDMDQLATEQYRVLYTRLEHISLKNAYKTFAITSAVKGEGKTITSINLAYVMAHDFNKKVVIVECDLKKPSILSYFMEPYNDYALFDVINGTVDLKTAVVRVEDTGLYLLPARHIIKNSCELLDSQRMKTVLTALKTEFDYIIIDSPPLLPMADMNVLSKIVDGLVLVVKAGKTPKDIVLKGAYSMHGANIVGIVLNGADAILKKYYY